MSYVNMNGVYATTHQNNQQAPTQQRVFTSNNYQQPINLNRSNENSIYGQNQPARSLYGSLQTSGHTNNGYQNPSQQDINRDREQFLSREQMDNRGRRLSEERRFNDPSFSNHPHNFQANNYLTNERSFRNDPDQSRPSFNMHTNQQGQGHNPLNQIFLDSIVRGSVTPTVINDRGASSYSGQQVGQNQYPKPDYPGQDLNSGPSVQKRETDFHFSGLKEDDWEALHQNEKTKMPQGYPIVQVNRLNTTGNYARNSHREIQNHSPLSQHPNPQLRYTPPKSNHQSFQDDLLDSTDYFSYPTGTQNTYPHPQYPAPFTPTNAILNPAELGVRGIPNIGNSCYM